MIPLIQRQENDGLLQILQILQSSLGYLDEDILPFVIQLDLWQHINSYSRCD